MHGSGGLLFVACLAALVPGSFVGAVNVDACDAGSGTCVDAALPGVVSDAAATADSDDDGSLAQLRVVQRHDHSTAPRQYPPPQTQQPTADMNATAACGKDKDNCGVGFQECCKDLTCNNVKMPGIGQCGKPKADMNATAACGKDKDNCGVGFQECCKDLTCNNVKMPGIGQCGKPKADMNATAACGKAKDKCGVGFQECCKPLACNNVKVPGIGQCGPAR